MSPYYHYRPLMKTGDVIAFSGKGLVSGLVKRVTRSPYSHVGLVVNAAMEEGFGQSVLLVESTTLAQEADIAFGRRVRGVQMHWLSQRVALYQGKIWWAGLRRPIVQENVVRMRRWLRHMHDALVPYDTVQAVGSALDWWDGLGLANRRDTRALFCSELVVRALQIAGEVEEGINPAECTPSDVMAFTCLDKAVQLI